ncbi:hypothetical protein D3C81_1843810 [compost metagenome]
MEHPAHTLNYLAFDVAPYVALKKAAGSIVQSRIGVAYIQPKHISEGVRPNR